MESVKLGVWTQLAQKRIPGEETVGMGYGYQAWQPDWDRDPSAWDYGHVSHGHGTWEGPEAARVKVS